MCEKQAAEEARLWIPVVCTCRHVEMTVLQVIDAELLTSVELNEKIARAPMNIVREAPVWVSSLQVSSSTLLLS